MIPIFWIYLDLESQICPIWNSNLEIPIPIFGRHGHAEATNLMNKLKIILKQLPEHNQIVLETIRPLRINPFLSESVKDFSIFPQVSGRECPKIGRDREPSRRHRPVGMPL